MKTVLYVDMGKISIAQVLELEEQGYEFLIMENGYALAAKGGIL